MPGKFRYITLSFLLLLPHLIFAQKEAAIWHFGRYAGLDFNSGIPVVIHGGQINTIEGVATISNSSGALMFYTDGVTVWNRLHQVMPNGTGLNGHISSTQSAIIVPKIGDASRYYVFTIDDYGSPQRLQYSVVNMNMDGGTGDLEVKNIPIITGVSEKLTAVRHCNQRDYWIITHSTFGNTYYAFLVDPVGVHTTPVVSQTGSSFLGLSVGYLKASPDGRKLAAANWLLNADISEFNNITGTISNTYGLFPTPSDTSYRVYGIEFSPNGKLVYASAGFISPVPNPQSGDLLLQYDVSLSTPAAVRASKQVIAKQLWISNFMPLQMAIDGKVYMAKSDQKEIDAINHPNVYGPGCGYTSSAIKFTEPYEKCTAGLPNFIQSYFFQRDSFSYNIDCPGSKVNFQKAASNINESFVWDFGDPPSGANNSSTMENPAHVYTNPGQHIVQLITYTPCGSDTLRRVIQTYGLKLYLGEDTLMCGGGTLQLIAGTGSDPYQYLWQDNSTNPTYHVTSPGTYWVEIRNPSGCTLSDSIRIDYDNQPNFSLGPDQFICPGKAVYLKPDLDPAWQLRWEDGSTAPDHTITRPGLYSLLATNGCGSVQDEVLIYKGVCNVYVPNAFTPNGDGKNDLFKILGTENVSSFHLKVFNRYGETVFETSDKANGWDGKYQGKYLPGTYVYLLEYKDTASTQPQNLKGSFILIR
jgi:gliding motility-associated-like protein